MAETIKVRGYREFMRACEHADKSLKREVRTILKDVGDIVQRDAAHKLEPLSPESARGYRTVVRQRGVSVEQTLRKTTGLRPDWGKTQMRKALYPAGEENEALLKLEGEHALNLIADVFNYGSY